MRSKRIYSDSRNLGWFIEFFCADMSDQKGFLLVCMLLYNTFLRPNEIRSLQIKDIHLFEHKIVLPEEAAKNKYERTVGITEEIEKLILDMGLNEAKSSDYLIGKEFKICDTMCPDHSYRKAWAKLRDELGMPEEELAIQVSWSIQDADTPTREVTVLQKLPKALPCRRRIILTYNEEEVIEDEYRKIEVLPIWKWLLK